MLADRCIHTSDMSIHRPIFARIGRHVGWKSPKRGSLMYLRLAAAALALGIGLGSSANANPGTKIERLDGVWIEGPGYDITYGGNYEACAQRCLATEKCLMIEYYRPEKKCNMYDAVRPRKTGGSSNVGIRR
jgi:hypothetical protein